VGAVEQTPAGLTLSDRSLAADRRQVWPNCGPASIPCSILINRFQTLQAGSTKVYEWGTSVHREHRGHKLGLATKAVNLRAIQTARSATSRWSAISRLTVSL